MLMMMSTMKAIFSTVSLLLLIRQGECFIVKGHQPHFLGGRQEGTAPRRYVSSSRGATLLDETDRLMFERVDSDLITNLEGLDKALLPVLFSINVVMVAAFLLMEGSPPVETPASFQSGDNGSEIERIQPPPTYNAEEDVTMWMDSSAGFFFY